MHEGKGATPGGRGARRATATLLTTLGVMLAGPAVAAATTYYVSPAGSNAITCTANSQSNPFQTVQAALTCTQNGDVVSLAPSGTTPYPGIGTVSDNVTIEAAPGANAGSVEIDLSQPSATAGPLLVPPGATVAVQDVNLDCVNYNNCATDADVTNQGILTLTGDNVTGGYAGGILNQSTGSTSAQLTVLDSTIAGNFSLSASNPGAGLTEAAAASAPAPSVTVANSTIADNTSDEGTGGVSVQTSSNDVLTLVNDTITDNTSNNGNDGGVSDNCSKSCAGTPIVASNTIIASNGGSTSVGYDCAGIIADGPGGHNLIGNSDDCTGMTNGTNGDLIGVPDPGLNALASNGGPIETASLQPQSPAIGTADPGTCQAAPISDADERGDARASATRGCDIGAYDTGGGGGTPHATWYAAPTGSDSIACSANSPSHPFRTIQAALACAGNGDVIQLAPSGSSPYPGIGALSNSVSIEAAPGANARTVEVDVSQPNDTSGTVTVPSSASALIEGVELNCVPETCLNPGVTNNGALTLQGVEITHLFQEGGVINESESTVPARLRLLDSAIVDNVSDASATAGGVYSGFGSGTPYPTAMIANSTIAGNLGVSDGPGGIYSDSLVAAGLILINDTITGNRSPGGPAGGIDDPVTPISASNTVIAGNTSFQGGDPDCQGDLDDGPGGHNLLGNDTGCSGLTNGVDGDQVGSGASPTAPLLAPPAYNGGPTETAPPLQGSPVIGAADPATCEAGPISDLDQRGDSRDAPGRGACDIGADDTGGATPSQTAPAITSGASANATISSPFSFTVSATGAPTPALSETGSLPNGLLFVDNGNGTATLSGTPASGTAGSYPITITADNGVDPAATQSFTLNVAALSVSTITPTTIAQGARNLAVTITGTGFQPGATLSASSSGLTFSSVSVKSATTILAKEKAAASVPTGAYNLTVTEPGTSATCSGCLNVLGPPTVTSMSPSTLAQGATGVLVTVNGTNFWNPATVSFTGPGSSVSGVVTFVGASSLQVKVTVPATAPTGSYTLNLSNGDGGTATCPGCLTVVAGPQISSISPTSVEPGEKTTFTVTGSGFSSDAKLTGPQGVKFSGVSVGAGGTSITATVTVSSTAPAGNNLPVTVTDGPLGDYGRATDHGLTVT